MNTWSFPCKFKRPKEQRVVKTIWQCIFICLNISGAFSWACLEITSSILLCVCVLVGVNLFFITFLIDSIFNFFFPYHQWDAQIDKTLRMQKNKKINKFKKNQKESVAAGQSLAVPSGFVCAFFFLYFYRFVCDLDFLYKLTCNNSWYFHSFMDSNELFKSKAFLQKVLLILK